MSLETPKVPKHTDRVDPSTLKSAPEHDPLQAYRMERSPSSPTQRTPKDFLDMHDLWKPSVDAPFNTPKMSKLDSTPRQFSFNTDIGGLPGSVKTDATTPSARADVPAAAFRADAAPGAVTREAAAKAPDAAPTADAGRANHVVDTNESLWTIAGDALRAHGHGQPSDHEVWKSVKDIISANKQEHPELQKNPDAITPGMKLNLPLELAARPEALKAETMKAETTKAEASNGEAPKTDEAKTDAGHDPIKLADAPTGETREHDLSYDPTVPHRGRHHRRPETEGEPGQHRQRPEHGHEGKEGSERPSRRHRGHGGGRGGRRRSRRHGHHTRQESRPRRHEQPEVEGEETENSKAPIHLKPGADGNTDSNGKPDDGTQTGADKPGKGQNPDEHDNPFAHAFKELGKGLGDLAHKVAGLIHTTGDCAKGPRLTFKRIGYDLPPMIATEQGAALEKSGLFKEVPRSEAQPGDYAYRHWNKQVIRSHGGVDKGDAFIVSGVGRHGELYGSNDHRFVVPEDGGRYRNTKFLRPTEEFWKLYGPKA